MDRDFDPRDHERERPGIDRGGRGASSRAHDPRDRDPRDVFTRDLTLPRGATRERVTVRSEHYFLRGSEVRTLATVGAFRVVPAEDLRRAAGMRARPVQEDIYRLRQAGLVRTLPHLVGHRRTTLVALTERGRDVLETHRLGREPDRQAFYSGAVKPRELAHDSQAYRAYLHAAERVRLDGGRVRRVVLDYELKGAYQRFLQGRNRARRNERDAAADHAADGVAEWARVHHLPVLDEHVQFPDVRIEYEHPDGRLDVEDIEVMTPHYRGALAAAKARSGFSCYRSASAGRVGGRSGRAGGGSIDPRLAEELLS